VLYIIHTTGKCNLNCKYCGGSFPPEIVPWKVHYSIKDLRKFIEGDNEVIIAFYGGEPLINSKFIMQVMDEIPHAKFVIQTNGTLISKLDEEYWRKFKAILLSIDGRKEVNDYYRGAKTYQKVIKAARWLKSIGFNGDLVARMTVSEASDIYKEVTHLLSLKLFDHIHWQLDVVWSNRWKNFDEWCRHSYKPGINRLAKLWVKEAKKGKILGLVPFLGILKAMIFAGKLESPPCGAGTSAIAISTDGRILACPIAVDVKWAELGNIWNCKWMDVINKVRIEEPCTSCAYFKYCGGRCLYAYFEKLWGEEGFRKICNLTIHTIKELLKIKDELLKLIDEKVVSTESIIYPKFNNTTEIIP